MQISDGVSLPEIGVLVIPRKLSMPLSLLNFENYSKIQKKMDKRLNNIVFCVKFLCISGGSSKYSMAKIFEKIVKTKQKNSLFNYA